MTRLVFIVLFTFAAASGQAQVPPVFLNHVVLVVDSASYAALGESAFLRDTRIAAEAAAFGYQVRRAQPMVLGGPDLTIQFVSSPGTRKGVVAVELALRDSRLSPGIRTLGPKVQLDVVSSTRAILRVR